MPRTWSISISSFLSSSSSVSTCVPENSDEKAMVLSMPGQTLGEDSVHPNPHNNNTRQSGNRISKLEIVQSSNEDLSTDG